MVEAHHSVYLALSSMTGEFKSNLSLALHWLDL
jgi:hypothetical protein